MINVYEKDLMSDHQRTNDLRLIKKKRKYDEYIILFIFNSVKYFSYIIRYN